MINEEEFLRLLAEPAEDSISYVAKRTFEIYLAYKEAGFTEEQAFKLLRTNMQNAGGNK